MEHQKFFRTESRLVFFFGGGGDFPNLHKLYFLLDNTTVITVHQKCEDNTFEEVLLASGGPWGKNL